MEVVAKFGARRWIEVDDPTLLDHEGVEILLLGAHAEEVEKELGIEIDDEVETAHSSELYRTLRLRKEARVAPLFRGEFPAQELPVRGEQVIGRTDRPEAGRKPATRATSRPGRGELRCKICHETFATRSQYERHKRTAHRTPAPSAADVERARSGASISRRHSGGCWSTRRGGSARAV
jgi:hypothetical protein